MPKSNDGALAGFTRFEFDDGRWTRPVYRIGSGPAVIVIHEALHTLGLPENPPTSEEITARVRERCSE